MVPNKHPIPVIDELLDELYRATIFFKIDQRAGLSSNLGFLKDICKIAFRPHQGHYKFLVMPFGFDKYPSNISSNNEQSISALFM